MKDLEFLDYCYYHSKTPRHLFTVSDVRRLSLLAGSDEPAETKRLTENAIVGMDFDFVEPRVQMAREKLKTGAPS
jgi:hypothetical protein